MNETFPEIISQLPTAEIPIPGVKSFVAETANQQFIFMSFDEDVEVPEHAHSAQWGVVLDGEIELTIDPVKRVFKKGDSYFIPKGVMHSARIKRGYKDLTLFDERGRYKVKDNK
jgi:quercetin dioxygenase-like cupin family protein